MEEQALGKMPIKSDAVAALVKALERINKDNAGDRVSKAYRASWFEIRKFKSPLLIRVVRYLAGRSRAFRPELMIQAPS